MAVGEISTFGLLLKRHRLAAGLTQEELAERARLSVGAITDLERGARRNPRKETVRLLAAALALSARDGAAFAAAARRSNAPTALLHSNGAHVPSGDLPRLVGRAQELALLERHLAGEGPPVLLLAGEPGIGKTRLLREAALRAGTIGWRVLWGGCQRGGQEPYAPLLGALSGYVRARTPAQLRAVLRGCAWLVRLLPELAAGPIEPLPAWTLPPEHERRLMFEAVGRFLGNVAGPAGTLLLFDDLQWAGADALDLLKALLRSDHAAPLRVVGAYRATEMAANSAVSAPLADLAQARLAMQRTLAPLTQQEAGLLLDQLLDDMAERQPALRERVLQRAGGLPFFLLSWAQGIRQGEMSEIASESVPWDVAQSIRQRVAAVPGAAQDLLRVAAVMGRQIQRATLNPVLTWAQDDVVTALEAACDAGLLAEEGQAGYRFAHDVVRDVIEADLSAARRALLHRRVAETLEQQSESVQGERAVETLAYHFARGDVPDKAAMYLEQAGDQARARYATTAAESYYQEAVEILDTLGRALDGARVREKLGTVLRTVARYDEALVALEPVAETYRASGDVESLGRISAQIAWVHADRGTPVEGVAHVQPVLEPLEAQGPSRGLASLYTALAQLHYFLGQYAEQLAVAERAWQLAQSVRDEIILADALLGRGLALYSVGRMSEALDSLESAIPVAEAAGNYYSLCFALLLSSDAYDERGDFDASRRYTQRALQIAERHGDRAIIALATTGHGMSAFFMGDWVAARRDYEKAVAVSRAVGAAWGAVYPLLDLGRLCLAEGAWGEASQYLEECERMAQSNTDLNAIGEVESVLAERDLLAGRAEAARDRLAPLVAEEGRQGKNLPFLLPRLAWALLELGDTAGAAEAVTRALTLARAEHKRLYLVDVLRVHAMVFIRQERWQDAERSIEEGLTLARDMSYPYAEGRLLHVYGLLHLAMGATTAAQERLEQALTIFRRLGARKDVEQVERHLADVSGTLEHASG